MFNVGEKVWPSIFWPPANQRWPTTTKHCTVQSHTNMCHLRTESTFAFLVPCNLHFQRFNNCTRFAQSSLCRHRVSIRHHHPVRRATTVRAVVGPVDVPTTSAVSTAGAHTDSERQSTRLMPSKLLVRLALAMLGAAAAAVGVVIQRVGGSIQTESPILNALIRVAKQGAPVATFVHSLVTSTTVRVCLVLYVVAFTALLVSHRAQTWLIYLHWIRPPYWLHRPDDVRRHGLAGLARCVRAGHLRGWHLKPPGPPFPLTDDDYAKLLRAPRARVILFFHGNSGTRAFPSKRVRVVSTLSAQFAAHVLMFDYTGFADTPGRPSEEQLYADARAVYAYARSVTSPDASVIIYGQSLGSFWAVDLAKHLSLVRQRDVGDTRTIAVILESAPSSLIDGAMSHPTGLPFRIIPGIDRILRMVLKEKLDSAAKMEHVAFPLLVMHGECDWMITPDQGRKLYERAVAGGNQHACLRMFADCGHNNVFSAERYLATVHEFLEKYAPHT